MRKFIGLVERYIIRIVVLSIIALVIVQGLLTHEPLRLYLSWSERLEGQIIEYPVAANLETEPSNSPLLSEARIVLVIDKYSALPQASVLVNGIKHAVFADNRIELDLSAGDVVEIDSTHYNLPIYYIIEYVSDNISFPAAGSVYTGNQSIVMLGKVTLKDK